MSNQTEATCPHCGGELTAIREQEIEYRKVIVNTSTGAVDYHQQKSEPPRITLRCPGCCWNCAPDEYKRIVTGG